MTARDESDIGLGHPTGDEVPLWQYLRSTFRCESKSDMLETRSAVSCSPRGDPRGFGEDKANLAEVSRSLADVSHSIPGRGVGVFERNGCDIRSCEVGRCSASRSKQALRKSYVGVCGSVCACVCVGVYACVLMLV